MQPLKRYSIFMEITLVEMLHGKSGLNIIWTVLYCMFIFCMLSVGWSHNKRRKIYQNVNKSGYIWKRCMNDVYF